MDRRKFVAMMVAAGVVGAGLNTGCGKNENNSVKTIENTNSQPLVNAGSSPANETPGGSNNLTADKSPDTTKKETPEKSTPEKITKETPGDNPVKRLRTPRPTHTPIATPGDQYTE
jgi:hypothetical protein